MLTQCPSCNTTFRVTSEILRVADGQVRCGRCHTQFDALERLLEENDAGDVQSGRYLRPTRPEPEEQPEIEVEEPESHEDITLEGRRIEISGVYRVLPEGADGEAQVREETSEEWVEIDDLADPERGPTSEETPDSEWADEPNAEDAAEPEAIEEDREPPLEAPVQSARARSPTWRHRSIDAEEPAQREDHEDLALLAGRRPARPRARLLWRVLAAPLALLLAAQVVHYYRSELARHPRLGAPLMSIYGALGLSLTPDWNLHAYEVRQWGVTSDPASPGTLKVRASIKNLAPFAQPYPLLKLVLEDRWGEQVRAREFEPSEYLDPTIAAHRLMAPAEQANATIAIVDPGPDAEGFRFDVCLRGTGRAVCAGEVPR
jgi:predicted Zn finger-like uncharacterized protein